MNKRAAATRPITSRGRASTAMAALLLSAMVLLAASPAKGARLKDLATIRGVRSNQLIGYGLVVGLAGTGDDQQIYFTLRSVQQMLRRLGVPSAKSKVFDLRNLRLRNTAAVIVTAELPPFARAGSRLNLTVSSLGNARSLSGGTLLLTPLRGVDLKVYALAQGVLTVGGFSAGGRTGSRIKKNHTTVATVPRGAIVEREVRSKFVDNKKIVVALRRPDFTTASRVVAAINKELGDGAATASDPATIVVRLKKGAKGSAIGLVARIEGVKIDPDTEAKVIINERTGTVIVGQDVRLKRVAISHGSLTLEISERFKVSQPRAPFGTGRTRVVPGSRVKATEAAGTVRLLESSASLADVVKALNALGATPRDLVSIFQALEGAGALPAKLVVQ